MAAAFDLSPGGCCCTSPNNDYPFYWEYFGVPWSQQYTQHFQFVTLPAQYPSNVNVRDWDSKDQYDWYIAAANGDRINTTFALWAPATGGEVVWSYGENRGINNNNQLLSRYDINGRTENSKRISTLTFPIGPQGNYGGSGISLGRSNSIIYGGPTSPTPGLRPWTFAVSTGSDALTLVAATGNYGRAIHTNYISPFGFIGQTNPVARTFSIDSGINLTSDSGNLYAFCCSYSLSMSKKSTASEVIPGVLVVHTNIELKSNLSYKKDASPMLVLPRGDGYCLGTEIEIVTNVTKTISLPTGDGVAQEISVNCSGSSRIKAQVVLGRPSKSSAQNFNQVYSESRDATGELPVLSNPVSIDKDGQLPIPSPGLKISGQVVDGIDKTYPITVELSGRTVGNGSGITQSRSISGTYYQSGSAAIYPNAVLPYSLEHPGLYDDGMAGGAPSFTSAALGLPNTSGLAGMLLPAVFPFFADGSVDNWVCACLVPDENSWPYTYRIKLIVNGGTAIDLPLPPGIGGSDKIPEFVGNIASFCHQSFFQIPHAARGSNAAIVARKDYVQDSWKNPDGSTKPIGDWQLVNPAKPWIQSIYSGANEVWTSPPAFQPGTCSHSDEDHFYVILGERISPAEITASNPPNIGVWTAGPIMQNILFNGRWGHYLISHNGSHVIPTGKLTNNQNEIEPYPECHDGTGVENRNNFFPMGNPITGDGFKGLNSDVRQNTQG